MTPSLVDAITNYQPSPAGVAVVTSTKILLLVGVSGAGKDTVADQLLKTGKYHSIISHTTRSPRANHGVLEQDGVEYHFISIEQAQIMLEQKAFVEAKLYSGNLYGTSVAEIKQAHDSGQIAVTDLEVQGVAEYKQLSDTVTAVFLLPPDYPTWQKRLHQRYDKQSIDRTDILQRMQTAAFELKHALKTGYFQFVVNNNLTTTVQTVDKLAHHQPVVSGNEQGRQIAEQLVAGLAGTLDT